MGLHFCYHCLWMLATTINRTLHVPDLGASPRAGLFIIHRFGNQASICEVANLRAAQERLSCLPLLHLLEDLIPSRK